MKPRLNSARGLSLVAWLCFAALVAGCEPAPTPMPTPLPPPSPTPEPEPVVLTLGGWRTATEQLNRVLAAFGREYPHITVRFEPVVSGEYEPVLTAELKAGGGPDLFYLRSFSASQLLYGQGYLEDLSGLPGLVEGFGTERLAPWTTDEGVFYGVPFSATSHGIYYNQDVFADLGLDVPQTWEELLTVAAQLQEAGLIPLANGSKDAWTSAEIVFMNLAPSFDGGREGRLAYLAGERCFDDEGIVATFQAVQDLAPFLPDDHHLLGYLDCLELFVQGQAAMWMSGSWDIPYFEAADMAFDWSVFAIPPPAGEPAYVVFHPDVGFGLNAVSEHKEEARLFLMWMTTPEFGTLLGNEMAGFFPMHRDGVVLDNEHANAFLALHEGRGTDVRFAWEKLGDGTPTGYELIQKGTEAVLRGEQTPEEAASALQLGLAEWFEPAQTCGTR